MNLDLGASDPQPLASDHDDAVAGDFAFDADRSGCRWLEFGVRDAGTVELGAFVGRDRRGQGLGLVLASTPSWTTCRTYLSNRRVTRWPASSGPIFPPRPVKLALPPWSRVRSTSPTA